MERMDLPRRKERLTLSDILKTKIFHFYIKFSFPGQITPKKGLVLKLEALNIIYRDIIGQL